MKEIIESAGMDLRDEPGPSTTPAQPAALSATAGDNDGTMDLSWDPVAAATSYVIEASADPPTRGFAPGALAVGVTARRGTRGALRSKARTVKVDFVDTP